MEYFLEIIASFVAVIGTFIALTGIIFILIIGLVGFYGNYSCDQYESQTGRETSFKWWASDCYVKTDNGWFLKKQINQNNVNKQ